MIQDLRFAIRTALKTPVSTTAAFLALTLGIGASTAIFSVVSTVMLRPLPVEAGNRLVRIFAVNSTNDQDEVSMADYLDWKKALQSFTGLAIYRFGQATLTGAGKPERVVIGEAEWTLSPLLGVVPVQGRNFLPEENQPGHRVALLSWAFWQSHFGAQNVCGKRLLLDQTAYTIVGVLPKSFTFIGARDIWIPVIFDSSAPENKRGYHSYMVLGRLRPGVSPVEATTELVALSASIAKLYPNENKGVSARAVPLIESLGSDGGPRTQTNIRSALLLLLGAVLCVLLIACGNVANLGLVRAWSRQQEIAVRIAVGAGRGRLFRQLLIESVLLSFAAALAGVALAAAAVHIFRNLPLTMVPRLEEITVDWRVLVFAVLLAISSGIGFGLLPALRASMTDVSVTVKQTGARSTESRHQLAVRRLFVALETGLAALLLVESGLLIKSFVKASRIDLRFEADHLLTVYISLSEAHSNYHHAGSAAAFAQNVLERIRSLPGVSSAAMTTNLPFAGSGGGGPILVEGQPSRKPLWQMPYVLWTMVSPRYFQTMQIPFLAGIDFEPGGSDTKAAIVNEALVRKIFSGQNPVGQRVSLYLPQPDWRRIVGVVADVPQFSAEKRPLPEIFLPIARFDVPWLAAAVRVNGEPLSYTNSVRMAVAQVDPTAAVFLPRSGEELIARRFLWRRLETWLVGAFAAVALVLACFGIYAVIAYSVSQRINEIGVRMALGASRENILRLVVLQGSIPAVCGAAAGLLCAFAVGRITAQQLFNVAPTDASTYFLVFVIMVALSALAGYFPARRAANLDPWTALRHE